MCRRSSFLTRPASLRTGLDIPVQAFDRSDEITDLVRKAIRPNPLLLPANLCDLVWSKIHPGFPADLASILNVCIINSMRQSKQKPKRGRPFLGAKAKKRINVMLSKGVAGNLRELGEDNLSAGIELATLQLPAVTPKERDRGLKRLGLDKGPADSGFNKSQLSRNESGRNPTMNAAVDARNPTGIKFTQAQMDESERQGYWYHAIEYGLQYYVTGRFASANRFTPVSANILHHAVELLLKACLAHDDTLEKIRDYWHPKKGYGHDIIRLWEAFKARRPAPVPAEFDAIINGLHAFEDIRYPETLIREGATISIGIFEVKDPILSNGRIPEKSYTLMLPQIDRLVGLLFDASSANPPAFLPQFTNDRVALQYYDMLRPTLFGRSATSDGNLSMPQSK
jgi:hypothetical protein